MRIVRFKRGANIEYGVMEGEIIFTIKGNIFDDFEIEKTSYPANEVRLLSPVQPGIIAGVGINYPAKKRPEDSALPKEPTIFFKSVSSVVGHLDQILLPQATREVKYGGELAVVMKRPAKRVKEEQSLEYVLGYTCANDVTAIDLFKQDMLSARAKSYFTFCPLGPCIATNVDGDNLRLVSRLNGVLQEEVTTNSMIFNIRQIISFISSFMTLEPGDVIITGSGQSGVDPTILKSGDQVEIEIEGIGILKNVVALEEVNVD